MSNILRCCPFCGGDPDFELAQARNGVNLVYVACQFCRARTNTVRVFDVNDGNDNGFRRAALLWNKRISDMEAE